MYLNEITLINKPSLDKRWMVIYTRSNWEKKADKLLKDNKITSFCPVIRTKRKWADRYKLVEQPLFKSYIFVCVDLYDQVRVQQIPGVLNFVQHCGKPVIISDTEISRVKTIIDTYADVQSVNKSFIVGDKILINDGPFANCPGEITHVQGASVLMVIEQLGCALIVKVNQNQIIYNNN